MRARRHVRVHDSSSWIQESNLGNSGGEASKHLYLLNRLMSPTPIGFPSFCLHCGPTCLSFLFGWGQVMFVLF